MLGDALSAGVYEKDDLLPCCEVIKSIKRSPLNRELEIFVR